MEGICFVVNAPQGTLGTLGIITEKKQGAITIVTIKSTSPLVNFLKIGDVIEAVFGDDSATDRKLFICRPWPLQKHKTPNPTALAPITNRSSSSTPKESNAMEKHLKTKEQALLLEKVPAQNADNTHETESKIVATLPTTLNLDEMPAPGFVCKNKLYYSTLSGETTAMVAEKLGCPSWSDLLIDENVKRYGVGLKANSSFHESTYLRIPTNRASNFKLEKLVDQQEIKLQELGVCLVCGGHENPNNDDMLLCDGCDDACCHLGCSDHATIPSHEWFCPDCLDILHARNVRYGSRQGGGSLVVNGPSKLAPMQLSIRLTTLVAKVEGQLVPHLRIQRDVTLPVFGHKQVQEMQARVDSCIRKKHSSEKAYDSCVNGYNETVKNICFQAGILAIHLGSLDYPRAVTIRSSNIGHVRLDLVAESQGGIHSENWRLVLRLLNQVKQHFMVESTARAKSSAWKELQSAKEAFDNVQTEFSALLTTLELKLQERKREYAGMMGDAQLPFETKAMLKSREGRPKLLGFVKVTQSEDAENLLALKSPTQFIVTLPLETQEEQDAILPGHEYAVFARSLLFCPTRNDELPLHTHGGTRNAQRHLIGLLSLDERNSATVISQAQVPPTVRARGNESLLEDFSKCLDLNELVRDCACDVDLPMAQTPSRLVQHGLQLRDYQKSSLQFMLDKENENSGLGFAGELWSRNQTFDGYQYYYCSLTGSLQSDIYNYNDDKPDRVAKHCGGLPRGGILADAAGLGKTVVCISLIIANPPSKENRVLRREYSFEDKPTHPLYSSPPSVYGACAASTRNVFLSNGTIVIAPMTLCSQWQSEIKKYAPWLSTLTIHSDEKMTVEELASVDVGIASTVALHQIKKKDNHLMKKLKRIHFHRMIIDESLQQVQCEKTCKGLAKLSSTYCWGVTGTPIGASLDDLHGQLSLLRIPEFARRAFWKNIISDPYMVERNSESLRVLRSLLSHVIVRHSKDQNSEGTTMVALPPCKVTTVLIPFGSEHEQNVYNDLEARTQQCFQALRRDSVDAVLGKYVELTGMMFGARQACSHTSNVDFGRFERLDSSLARQSKMKKQTTDSEQPVAQNADGAQTVKDRAFILTRAVEWAPESAKNRVRGVILQFQEGEVELMECQICFEPFSETEAAVTECGHCSCKDCIMSLLKIVDPTSRNGKSRCPTCRADIALDKISFLGEAKDAGKFQARPKQVRPAPNANINVQGNGILMTANDLHASAANDSKAPRSVWEPMTEVERRCQRAYHPTLSEPFLENYELAAGSIGTKVSCLLQEINEMVHKNPSHKAVVFSQFVGTLDCAAQEMAARGIRFVRIDDNMKQHERADALSSFSTDPNVKVFLLSMIRVGGAMGLNLTAASWCFLLDTPMNSVVEEQAISRVHRLGSNTTAVFVKRFVVQNTVEERILAARHRHATSDGTTTSLVVVEEQEQTTTLDKMSEQQQQDVFAHQHRRFEKLAILEMLFGCSVECAVAKA